MMFQGREIAQPAEGGVDKAVGMLAFGDWIIEFSSHRIST
jgi:hypothetical protein